MFTQVEVLPEKVAIQDFSPKLKSEIDEIEKIAIFKAKARVDPVIAIKIRGEWFSLFEW